MRKAYRVIIVLGVCLFVLHILPPVFFALAAILTFFGLRWERRTTEIIGYTRRRKLFRFWMISALLCLIFIPSIWQFSGATGIWLGDQYFKYHLNEYTQIVDDVKNGMIPCGAELSPINVKKTPPCIMAVSAIRCNDGKAVLVVFWSTFGSALGHRGYLYKDYAETDTCISQDARPEHLWVYFRHIAGNWYQFSD